ncbi:MAG: CRISPR-associated endonuclease Cas2 [Stygiobacter sp.]|jgi:CRISPR-associated protein Cas2|uniref:CRISPR-associated endoribonuclease Cas2 n=1 Tax=Stygiobacter electus TaxID=3032292 RepID=A0AAE3NTH8_9BACT|nr:CRISPR-associated endonuclease Cas2 [Stygiobacter electus]MDF1610541.1 CRISPR-associated endonuclease Cas2 [Stygiobacter electus]
MNHTEPVSKVFYIAVYDITQPKRLAKALKTFRKYMNWVQNSAFEGELTARQFQDLKDELLKIINKEKDSVIFYHAEEQKHIGKKIIGIEKNEITQFY